MTSDMRAVLERVAELEQEIAELPEPPAWRRWDVDDLADLRANGPIYSPSVWFGDGGRLPESVRQRYLRAVQRLAAEGMVKTTHGEGGRLRNVKLTPAGRAALATLHPVAEPVGAGS